MILMNTIKINIVLITTYKEDSLDIEEDLYRIDIRRFTQDSLFIKAKEAMIANPEAGETFYLNQDGQDILMRIAVQEANHKFPVFSGAYGTSVEQVVETALHAKEMGADGIFAFPPTALWKFFIALILNVIPKDGLNILGR